MLGKYQVGKDVYMVDFKFNLTEEKTAVEIKKVFRKKDYDELVDKVKTLVWFTDDYTLSVNGQEYKFRETGLTYRLENLDRVVNRLIEYGTDEACNLMKKLKKEIWKLGKIQIMR